MALIAANKGSGGGEDSKNKFINEIVNIPARSTKVYTLPVGSVVRLASVQPGTFAGYNTMCLIDYTNSYDKKTSPNSEYNYISSISDNVVTVKNTHSTANNMHVSIAYVEP